MNTNIPIFDSEEAKRLVKCSRRHRVMVIHYELVEKFPTLLQTIENAIRIATIHEQTSCAIKVSKYIGLYNVSRIRDYLATLGYATSYIATTESLTVSWRY